MDILNNIRVYNVGEAIRAIRNSYMSWHKGDTVLAKVADSEDYELIIGPNDMTLITNLIKAGTPHQKFLRQIFVSMDVTLSLATWKQMDQYKVGTTTNSTSTMHNVMDRPITIDDFYFTDLDLEVWKATHGDSDSFYDVVESVLGHLNQLRHLYISTKDKRYWNAFIQLLPSGYRQMRTWTGTFANLADIYEQRRAHKMPEWRQLCEEVWNEVPYFKDIFGGNSQ